MEALISIIVPIYKVEKYLRRCVDSILNQTYQNIEVILVNDGSPDGCPIICDEYVKQDNRVKVVHKKNGGLSAARNAGIKTATGEWLYFVDSDDYIALDVLEELMQLQKKENVDIVIGTSDKIKYPDKKVVGSGEYMYYFILKNYCWEAWGKLIRKELVEGRIFPEQKLYEDLGYIPYTVYEAKRVALINNGKYFYTIRDDSIMGKSKTTLSLDLVEMVEKLIKFSYGKKIHSFTLDFGILFLWSKFQTIKDNLSDPFNEGYANSFAKLILKNLKWIFVLKKSGAKLRLKIMHFAINRYKYIR